MAHRNELIESIHDKGTAIRLREHVCRKNNAADDSTNIIIDFTVCQDSIKLTSGTVTSASFKGSDMGFKIGSGSFTVTNGKDKEIFIGSSIYFNNFVYDAKKNAVTLASGFTSSLKATDYASSTIKKINASAVSKFVNLVGNPQANTIAVKPRR